MKKTTVCLPGTSEHVELDLLTLPFIATYKILSWRGTANNSVLTKAFDVKDVQNRIMIIKSFSIYNYYPGTAVDLYVNDGTTTNQETIPTNARIDRLFDEFVGGTTIDFRLNNQPVSFFQAATGISFPADLDLQNIFYKYPESIQSIQLKILTTIYDNIVSGSTSTTNPLVKVIMETYLI